MILPNALLEDDVRAVPRERKSGKHKFQQKEAIPRGCARQDDRGDGAASPCETAAKVEWASARNGRNAVARHAHTDRSKALTGVHLCPLHNLEARVQICE